MNTLIKPISAFLLLMVFVSCNTFTYTPHSKKKMQKEKPSPVLLDKIIAYREEFNSWPFSREEFISRPAYRNAFDGFPYMQIRFKVIDNNSMTFYFSEHRKDLQQFQQSQRVDLNSYAGEVKFYREKEKFIWKIKMH